jgi:hypothetical protein
MMKSYNIPTNQFAEYSKSIHGVKLIEENQLGAPNCADCHGVHGATPPGVKEIPLVCGTCHSQTEKYFDEGRHGAAMIKYGEPQCTSCHGNHAIEKSSDRMFSGRNGLCGKCHDAGGRESDLAATLGSTLPRAEALLGRCRKKLEYLDYLNIFTPDLKARLESSVTSLIEARALQHTVDHAKVQAKLDAGNANAGEIIKECDLRLREFMKRKQLLIGAAFFFLFTGLLVWMKRMSLA